MSESVVQKKLAKLILQEVSEILVFQHNYVPGTLITLSAVRVTGDLSIAKIYVTVLPESKLPQTLEALTKNAWEIRYALAKKIKNKVRIIPELRFFHDDSFQEANRIQDLLDGTKNEEKGKDKNEEKTEE